MSFICCGDAMKLKKGLLFVLFFGSMSLVKAQVVFELTNALIDTYADAKLPDDVVNTFLCESQRKGEYKLSDEKTSAVLFEALFEGFANKILRFCKENQPPKMKAKKIVDTLQVMLTQYARIVSLLIAAGIKVEVTYGKEQMTPLMHATQRGFYLVVKKLVEKGASIFAKDQKGRTAIDYVQKFPSYDFCKEAASSMLKQRKSDIVLREVFEYFKKKEKAGTPELFALYYYQATLGNFLKKAHINEAWFYFLYLEPYHALASFLKNCEEKNVSKS